VSKLCFPEEVLNQHLVVLGKTGAGKSSALRHVVEHLLDAEKRVCIIDPKGDWWGLKSSADGKSAGFPVIAFGDFKNPQASDVPVNPQSGKHVAELITSGNRPCVIGFRGWMPGQMADFWIDFASTLFNTITGELYVVVDEVHNFAPKGKILDPKAGKVIHWTNRLLSEGRGLGMVFLIASQRPQKVHNDTLTCCETLVAMRVVHKADRDAIEDWIKGCGDGTHGKELLNNVAGMARGEAYVWSPEIAFGPERLKFPMFHTFDSFAPPQLQKKVSQSGWSEVNLDEVKLKLATVIEETKANDPKELKKRIHDLEQKIQDLDANVRPDGELAAAVAQAQEMTRALVTEQWSKAFEEYKANEAAKTTLAIEALKGASAVMTKTIESLASEPQVLVMDIRKDIPSPVAFGEQFERAAHRVKQPHVIHRPPPPTAEDDRRFRAKYGVTPRTITANGNLSGPQRELLTRLGDFWYSQIPEVNLSWLAASLGTTARSRGFEENMRAVRNMGYADVSNKAARLTDGGHALVGKRTHLNGAALRGKITAMMSGPQADMFNYVVERGPISLEHLATHFATTTRARGFEENLRFLRTNEVIEKHGEHVIAADWVR
jgi:hypothetical protein